MVTIHWGLRLIYHLQNDDDSITDCRRSPSSIIILTTTTTNNNSEVREREREERGEERERSMSPTDERAVYETNACHQSDKMYANAVCRTFLPARPCGMLLRRSLEWLAMVPPGSGLALAVCIIHTARGRLDVSRRSWLEAKH